MCVMAYLRICISSAWFARLPRLFQLRCDRSEIGVAFIRNETVADTDMPDTHDFVVLFKQV
jgi:hypothetical protein